MDTLSVRVVFQQNCEGPLGVSASLIGSFLIEEVYLVQSTKCLSDFVCVCYGFMYHR